ncbi:MAG: fructose-6-phosphate aldolase [Acidobacteriota bacterium]
MKFFLDTANVEEIRQAASLGVLDGVTTNPSLVAKEGRPFEEVVHEICEIVDGPVSAEVVSLNAEEMVEEARRLAAIHQHVVVKIPMLREGMKAVCQLVKDEIRVNVTLCFSPTQALIAAKAGATYISPFVGRLDDISHDGMELVQQIVTIYENYGFPTEVLVGSARHPKHVLEAALIGADVATLPYNVFDALFNHPLTDIGLEKFLADWRKARELIAPQAVETAASET